MSVEQNQRHQVDFVRMTRFNANALPVQNPFLLH